MRRPCALRGRKQERAEPGPPSVKNCGSVYVAGAISWMFARVCVKVKVQPDAQQRAF